jgi:hypothetical protein
LPVSAPTVFDEGGSDHGFAYIGHTLFTQGMFDHFVAIFVEAFAG